MTNSEALVSLEEEQGIGFSLVMVENVTIVGISSYTHVQDVEGWTIVQIVNRNELHNSRLGCIQISQ